MFVVVFIRYSVYNFLIGIWGRYKSVVFEFFKWINYLKIGLFVIENLEVYYVLIK